MTTDLGQLAEARFNPRDSFLGPITRSSITMIYGQAGTGKSYLALAMLMAMARGVRLLSWGCGVVARSLIVDGEMGLAVQQKRVESLLGDDKRINCDSIHFFTYEDCNGKMIWNISRSEDQIRYTSLFTPFDVVVIDNLSTCSYPKDDRDGEIAQWIRTQPWLVALRDAGKAIILIHHTNKQGLQLGSSMKEFIADTVIKLKKVEHKSGNLVFDLCYDKHRHMTNIEASPIRVTAVQSSSGWAWSFETMGASLERQVVELTAANVPLSEIAKQLGLPTIEVVRLAQQAGVEQ